VSKFFDQEDDVGEPKLQHCQERIGISAVAGRFAFPNHKEKSPMNPTFTGIDDERFCSALFRVQRRKPVLLK